MKYITEDQCRRLLNKKKLISKKSIKSNLWDVFYDNIILFNVDGPKFYSKNEKIFSIFQGYEYEILKDYNNEIIDPFIKHIYEVICDNDKELFNYVISWISSLLQNPGKKLEVALAIIGGQGCGKTYFTNTICDLIKSYSERNVTNLSEITCKYNSV